MSDLSTRDVLAALQLPKVGPSTVRKLWNAGGSRAGGSLLEQIESLQGKRGVPLSQSQLQQAYDTADKIIEQSRKLSISVLSPVDESFPRALLDLPDYPPVIYVKGSLGTLGKPKKLAVVGTRQASELGLRLARKIASELSNLDICVVSGLALGIDTAAHQGALRGKGSTIAILAHGLDQTAPKSNEELAASILDHDGVLLSEHEIGVIPRPPQFVSRNRLQSGLSRGSIVVESGATGGSIYQGKFTAEQRRLLFVVMPDDSLPGVAQFHKEGGVRLHQEFGARKISRLDDILSAIPEFHMSSPDTVQKAAEKARNVEDQAPIASPVVVKHEHIRESSPHSDAYEADVKNSLAVHHLLAAEFFALQAEALERSSRHAGSVSNSCSYAIGAVLTSVAFLEAMITDIYLGAVDGPPSSPFADFIQTEAVANEWRSPKNPRWSLLEKYDRALEVAGARGYKPTDRLRNDADSLVHLRDSLVHYRPEWDNNLNRHKEVEKRLAGKFAESAFSDGTQAFFPHRCLGAGCARWAVMVATNFAIDVRTRLGLSEGFPVDHASVRQKTA